MSFPIGPTVSRCSGSIGNTPSVETKPWVVFKPTTPQQAAGTRIEPAVSVPKATSAIPLATATADPHEEPPGISFRQPLSGLVGVPKYSLKPEGATANSLMFVLPTNCTFRSREMARHGASFSASACVFASNSEPAVVTTPFMSMLSLTATFGAVLLCAGAQYLMKARLPESFVLKRGKSEQPLKRTSDDSASRNDLPGTRRMSFT